jgi:hypothetical protein
VGGQKNLQRTVIAQARLMGMIRNISQAVLQKLCANKIKQVQACIDARGHHFQNLSQVHSEFSNVLYLRFLKHFVFFVLILFIGAFYENTSSFHPVL